MTDRFFAIHGIAALLVCAAALGLLTACDLFDFEESAAESIPSEAAELPEYSYDEGWMLRPFSVSEDLKTPPPSSSVQHLLHSDEPYTEINGGVPYFSIDALLPNVFMYLSPLDGFGRVGSAVCCVGSETLCHEERPTTDRENPTGWQSVHNDDIDGGYLYHRSHLLAYALTGENSDERNLFTGTSYLNTVTMAKYERQINDYITSTGNHVVYRVTPVFLGSELVARGVILEAFSVEDGGAGICICVFLRNIQPGMEIDYATCSAVPRG